jgi:glycolate oxidase FAD binding subunit
MEILSWESLKTAEKCAIQKAFREDCHSLDWVAPLNVEELSDFVCQVAAQKQSILPMGSGSKLGWGNLVNPVNYVISTQELNRLVDHAIADLTITAEAGMKLADLQALLKPHRQFLPIDPAYSEQATLGGIMATGDTGSWRQRYGGIRDLVLGFSFVRWDGKIAKAGSRVVKNVAGYDLMKLFTGSYGTLGIISQITFRLYPLPETSQTLWLSGQAASVATLAQQFLKSGLAPTAADILSSDLAQSLHLGSEIGLLVRFQNIPESVQEQVKQLQAMAAAIALNQRSFIEEEERQLWQNLSSTMTVPKSEAGIICKIGVMPEQAVNFLQPYSGLGQIHLATGLGRLSLSELDWLQLSPQRLFCEKYRGFLTVLASSASLKETFEPWGYSGNSLKIMRQLKHKFDPHHCFSPGRFWSDHPLD